MSIDKRAAPGKAGREMQEFGRLIEARRGHMEMSLSQLSREMGGSPGPSFLSRVEGGEVQPTARVAVRLADALRLPRDIVLNACGFATPAQAQAAKAELSDLAGAPSPVTVSVPVMDLSDPDLPADMLPRRQRVLQRTEDVFIVDLDAPGDRPYVGEVIASRARKPKEGTPVVALVHGRVGAWEWHSSRPTGDWLVNGTGEKASRDFRVLGVILRVTSHQEFGE